MVSSLCPFSSQVSLSQDWCSTLNEKRASNNCIEENVLKFGRRASYSMRSSLYTNQKHERDNFSVATRETVKKSFLRNESVRQENTTLKESSCLGDDCSGQAVRKEDIEIQVYKQIGSFQLDDILGGFINSEIHNISLQKRNRRLLLSSFLSGMALFISFFSMVPKSESTELKEEEGPKKKSSRNEPQRNVIFQEIENGIKVLDIRDGNGALPKSGDKVAIHYYARLAAKQGWRFDSTYDHKDSSGAPLPFEFVLDSPSVISGLSTAVKGMKVGGTRRAVIPPTQGYQSTTDEPLPPNFFDRQRLFTTIFNPTRIQNGEGSTLGTLVFDIQLLGIRQTF